MQLVVSKTVANRRMSRSKTHTFLTVSLIKHGRNRWCIKIIPLQKQLSFLSWIKKSAASKWCADYVDKNFRKNYCNRVSRFIQRQKKDKSREPANSQELSQNKVESQVRSETGQRPKG